MGRFAGIELDGLELAGPRVRLRPWRAGDAEAVHRAMQDGSIHRFLPLPHPYTPADATHFVTDAGLARRRAGTGLDCAVVDRVSGTLLGSASVRLVSHSGLGADAEIGYWIAPAARGHGHAAEAAAVLRDWAFGAGVERILLLAEVHNLASVRTALACGFRFEGVSRAVVIGPARDGGPVPRRDSARFALLAGDAREPIAPALPWPAEDEPALTDATIRLRPVRPGDADAMIAAEDAVARGWGFDGRPPDPLGYRARAAQAGLDWLVGRIARFAIVDVASGRCAGFLDLRTGPPQVAGIGYTVHPDFRGRGFTARALRLVSAWAFGAAGFARLELGAKDGNVASQRAAVSGGFEPDGVCRARLRNPDGSFSDEVRFVLVSPRLR